MNKAGIALGLLVLWFATTGELCTKAIVYGKDYHTKPYAQLYPYNRETLLEGAKKTLEQQGYGINYVDEAKGQIVSGWRSVEGDSHYYNLFGRKDYGVTDGAYYQMVIDFLTEGSKVRVTASTTTKSIAGRFHSSGKVEKRFHAQLADYLRSPLIEMTNVGVDNR